MLLPCPVVIPHFLSKGGRRRPAPGQAARRRARAHKQAPLSGACCCNDGCADEAGVGGDGMKNAQALLLTELLADDQLGVLGSPSVVEHRLEDVLVVTDDVEE